MPLAWLLPPQAVPPRIHHTASGYEVAVDQDFTVDSKAFTWDPKRQILVVTGEVVAHYDIERLTAQRLEIHLAPNEQRAIASGKVQLIDPDGTLTTESVDFTWLPGKWHASASNTVVKVAGATVKARQASLNPGVWEFTDFSLTTDRNRPPLYLVSGRKLTVYPGHYGKVEKPTLAIFGQHIITLNSYRFNLDPRATGLRPPSPALREGRLGYNWTAGQLIDPKTSFEWHSDSLHGALPGNGIQLTHTFVPDGPALRPIAPRSELLERFNFGFFESALVHRPEDEQTYLAEPRDAITAFTTLNAAPTARGAPNEVFTFPISIGYENGGKLGPFGFLTDYRLENMNRVGGPVETRGELEGSLELPRLEFNPKLSFISRVDAQGFQSWRSFGWARLSGGFVEKVIPGLTLSAGLMGAVQGGTPDFDIDPLVYRDGAMLRADYAIGPRRLTLLERYDHDLGWFDREIVFSQAMGSLEFYYIQRQYPGDHRIGITLRLEQFTDLITRRKASRLTPSSP